MITRNVEYSRTEQTHIIRPSDLNGGGRLFGGTLLKMIDEIAAIVAMRHCGFKSVTTAAIDNLVFKSGAYVNDMIVLVGYVTYTGTTSMEVRVDTYVERTDGMRYPINRAHIILVALDEKNRPAAIPQLVLENDIQQEEFMQAKRRKELCLKQNTN